MLTPGLFQPSLVAPLVSVESTEDRSQVRITWPAIAGAYGYRVYGGFDPVNIRSLISGASPLPSDQLSFIFNTPFYPPGQVLYFWVASVSSPIASPVFIDEVGSYTLRTLQVKQFTDDTERFANVTIPGEAEASSCGGPLSLIEPGDAKYYMEEMRRRSFAVLADTGEEADLFIKQWRGLPDPTTQSQLGLDPNYQSMTRSDKTFGVGFYPGYFPAIKMRMRFGALPQALLEYQVPGLRPLLTNEAWTLWDPIMHENDLIVRVSTGQRYVIQSVAYSNWRGVPITQRITLNIVTPTSPLQTITDQVVRERWGLVNSADYLRAGFGIGADSVDGGPDYLIFGPGG